VFFLQMDDLEEELDAIMKEDRQSNTSAKLRGQQRRINRGSTQSSLDSILKSMDTNSITRESDA